ncbi:MAG: hypothetical protein KatS3mg113_1091 [Planctomycetaceae bacterium]|nr:MAG: hypothetical protein KatS3mg113_1091 [Planctomycetaceae bacterium]
MRAFATAWIVMGVLLGLLSVWIWCWPSTPPPPVTLTEAERQELAAADEAALADILGRLERRLRQQQPVQQVLILQAIPDDYPRVLVLPPDTSGEPQEAGWPSPWEAVNQRLSSGKLEQPCELTAEYHGWRYLHTLIPIDESHTRVLLIHRVPPERAWGALPGGVLSLGVVCLWIGWGLKRSGG